MLESECSYREWLGILDVINEEFNGCSMYKKAKRLHVSLCEI